MLPDGPNLVEALFFQALGLLKPEFSVAGEEPAQLAAAPDGEPSATVAGRVAAARRRALHRQGCCNSQLSPAQLDQLSQLGAAAQTLLQRAAGQLGWSGRGYHRVLRVARSIADLAGSAAIEPAHMAEALQLRRGLV